MKERVTARIQELTKGGVAAGVVTMPGGLKITEDGSGDYVYVVAKGENTGVTGMLMIKGVNGNVGITVREGHAMITDVTGAKDLTSPGTHESNADTKHGNFGQVVKPKGEKKKMSKCDVEVGLHGSRRGKEENRARVMIGSDRGSGGPTGCTSPTCRAARTSTRAWE